MLQKEKYDLIIIIASYNRYDMLCNLLNKIAIQNKKVNTKIIVNDDCSSDIRYASLNQDFSDVTFLRSPFNKGKDRYWQTINELLAEVKKYDFEYVLTIPDDFDICDNFLDLIIDEHKTAKELDSQIICTSYANISKIKRWNLPHWMDGDGIFDNIFFEKINFTIDPIKPSGKNVGSGVWKQISQKINTFNFKIHKPKNIFITHLGHTDSKMHPQLRKIKKLIIEKTI